MNYQRIYDELITDRRINQPSEEEYVEVHHIVPRCMGGGNEAENLIRLRPEDHYFAHLVLAHIHRTRELWAACLLMSGNRWSEIRKHRKMYGMVRRLHNASSVGIDAPNADTSEYTFYHLDGDVFTGTRIDFGAYADVPASSVNPLVRGNNDAMHGWRMSPRSRAEHDDAISASRSANGKKLKGFIRDSAIRHYYHRDTDTSVVATQIGFRKMASLSVKAVSALVCGSRAVTGGWCLLENAEWAYEHASPKTGSDSPHYDPTVYSFVNDLTGNAAIATINEMGRMYSDGDSRPFGEVARRTKGGWKGWRLSDARPARTLGLRHTLYKDDRTISGTQRELMAQIGVSPMAVSMVITGVKTHTKGWRLAANDNVQYSLPLAA